LRDDDQVGVDLPDALDGEGVPRGARREHPAQSRIARRTLEREVDDGAASLGEDHQTPVGDRRDEVDHVEPHGGV
jgi:hypothetical protein